jgi:hypothetical protein
LNLGVRRRPGAGVEASIGVSCSRVQRWASIPRILPIENSIPPTFLGLVGSGGFVQYFTILRAGLPVDLS